MRKTHGHWPGRDEGIFGGYYWLSKASCFAENTSLDGSTENCVVHYLRRDGSLVTGEERNIEIEYLALKNNPSPDTHNANAS